MAIYNFCPLFAGMTAIAPGSMFPGMTEVSVNDHREWPTQNCDSGIVSWIQGENVADKKICCYKWLPFRFVPSPSPRQFLFPVAICSNSGSTQALGQGEKNTKSKPTLYVRAFTSFYRITSSVLFIIILPYAPHAIFFWWYELN